jgi:hypothetical protein
VTEAGAREGAAGRWQIFVTGHASYFGANRRAARGPPAEPVGRRRAGLAAALFALGLVLTARPGR